LDSTGIGALVAGRHHAAARGLFFEVVNPHGIVARILAASGAGAVLGGDSNGE
jgi:anti-anti-sigma regulatory factor